MEIEKLGEKEGNFLVLQIRRLVIEERVVDIIEAVDGLLKGNIPEQYMKILRKYGIEISNNGEFLKGKSICKGGKRSPMNVAMQIFYTYINKNLKGDDLDLSFLEEGLEEGQTATTNIVSQALKALDIDLEVNEGNISNIITILRMKSGETMFKGRCGAWLLSDIIKNGDTLIKSERIVGIDILLKIKDNEHFERIISEYNEEINNQKKPEIESKWLLDLLDKLGDNIHLEEIIRIIYTIVGPPGNSDFIKFGRILERVKSKDLDLIKHRDDLVTILQMEEKEYEEIISRLKKEREEIISRLKKEREEIEEIERREIRY